MQDLELEFQKSINRLAIARLAGAERLVKKEYEIQMKLTRAALSIVGSQTGQPLTQADTKINTSEKEWSCGMPYRKNGFKPKTKHK